MAAAKRVKAEWCGPPSTNHEIGEINPGDTIEVWDHEVKTNPHLKPLKKAGKPANVESE